MFNKRKITKALCLLMAAWIMSSVVGCGKGQSATDTVNSTAEGQSAEVSMESETEDNLSRVSVTLPNAENAAVIYHAWDSTRESTQEGPTEETTTAKDCEFTRTGKPAVALTFDDGPSKGPTDQILNALEKYNAHATFFIVGKNVSVNPEAVKREYELGCELGTHTWSHEKLTALDESGINSQIDRSVEAIEQASGGKVTVMRPPWGAIDSDVKSILELPIIIWSLDTLDWQTRDVQSTVSEIQNNVRGGDIILMHDIHQETADAVDIILPWLVENGYELLTVSELYEYYGEDLSLHKGHGSAQ